MGIINVLMTCSRFDKIADTMKLNKYVRRIACCLTVVALLGSAAHAQMVERLCRTDYEIDPERQGELLVELDNISFFKDN